MSTRLNRRAKSHPAAKKPIADHLSELRWRLAVVVAFFVIASALAYNVRDFLVHIVLSPIGNQKLVYLTPAGGFSFIFSITIYAGLVVTIPLLIYHLYKFIAPALPNRARKHSLAVIGSSVALMLAGASFGYFVAIPAALTFLTNFAGEFVTSNLTADSYLSFVVVYLLGLGLLFQLPLLLIFWNWIRPFKKGGLLATQRFVVVGAFIAAAMITPTPDVFNQSLIAMPILVIYQIGVVAVFFMNKRRKKDKVSFHAPVSKSAPTQQRTELAPSVRSQKTPLPQHVTPFKQEETKEARPTMQKRVIGPAIHSRTRSVDGIAPLRPPSRRAQPQLNRTQQRQSRPRQAPTSL